MAGGALSACEREEILIGVRSGLSCRRIAGRLGRSASTVSRELARNGGRGGYSAVAAQDRADWCRRRPKRWKLVADKALAGAVQDLLRAGYSPAVIAVMLARRGGPTVCAETIYRALYHPSSPKGLFVSATRCLRSKRASRKPRNRHAAHPGVLRGPLRRVAERPESAANREPGHWEGDLIIGAHHQSAVITLVERHSRYLHLGALTARERIRATHDALAAFFASQPAGMAQTLTWDRGWEMALWADLEAAARIQVFFCDARSPWQRPSNENTNRLIRWWLPKSTPLGHYTQADLDRIADHINHTPRRLHRWASAAEVYAAAAMR